MLGFSTGSASHDLGVALARLFMFLSQEHRLKQLLRILVLPAVLLVLVAQRVGQGKRVLQLAILALFESDLILDEQFDKLKLIVEALELSCVGIDEVVCLEVQTWPTRHNISYDLHQSLLFQRINYVLIALDVGHGELDLLEVKRCFTFQQVTKRLQTILGRLWLLNVHVLEHFRLVDEV